MDTTKNIRDVQNKIIEIMKFIDQLCRENSIIYFIMGGTALGAVRHGGFIPWDDDLDIFMTPNEYNKFKWVFKVKNSQRFILQEWKTTPKYLEYAKVRMNDTTFIEENFKDRKDMHHGIYVDIMILHKAPMNSILQKVIYYESKFVTLFGLSQRNWVPKSKRQKFILKSLKVLPCKLLVKICYWHIYYYDHRVSDFMYCYWITPAKFRNGLFSQEFFAHPVDILFEDTKLMGPRKIKEYLAYRYGDYMKLPAEVVQKAAIHAYLFDVNKDYTKYINELQDV